MNDLSKIYIYEGWNGALHNAGVTRVYFCDDIYKRECDKFRAESAAKRRINGKGNYNHVLIMNINAGCEISRFSIPSRPRQCCSERCCNSDCHEYHFSLTFKVQSPVRYYTRVQDYAIIVRP